MFGTWTDDTLVLETPSAPSLEMAAGRRNAGNAGIRLRQGYGGQVDVNAGERKRVFLLSQRDNKTQPGVIQHRARTPG
jgi:hypothetical protein